MSALGQSRELAEPLPRTIGTAIGPMRVHAKRCDSDERQAEHVREALKIFEAVRQEALRQLRTEVDP